MSKLITQDLISAIDWLKTCPPSWQEKAYTDLKNKLARIYEKIAPAAQKGIDFEAFLNKSLQEKLYLHTELNCSEHFKDLMNKLKDYEIQKKTKSFLIIDDIDYCLYGRMDYFKKDHIIDLKTTNIYKGKDKYLNSWQHKIYCYNEKIQKFSYFVCEFESEDSKKINELFILDYEAVGSWEDLKKEIIGKIKECMSFLKQDNELFKLYNTKYSQY